MSAADSLCSSAFATSVTCLLPVPRDIGGPGIRVDDEVGRAIHAFWCGDNGHRLMVRATKNKPRHVAESTRDRASRAAKFFGRRRRCQLRFTAGAGEDTSPIRATVRVFPVTGVADEATRTSIQGEAFIAELQQPGQMIVGFDSDGVLATPARLI